MVLTGEPLEEAHVRQMMQEFGLPHEVAPDQLERAVRAQGVAQKHGVACTSEEVEIVFEEQYKRAADGTVTPQPCKRAYCKHARPPQSLALHICDGGDEVPVPCFPTDTVRHVAEGYARRTGVSPDTVVRRLEMDGERMDLNATIESCELRDGARVDVAPKQRGGGGEKLDDATVRRLTAVFFCARRPLTRARGAFCRGSRYPQHAFSPHVRSAAQVDVEYSGRGTYRGKTKDGKPHGPGKLTYEDGRVYEGEWERDRRHGDGKLTYNDGRVYDGAWKRGNRHGQGKLTDKDGNVLHDGEWKDDKLVGEPGPAADVRRPPLQTRDRTLHVRTLCIRARSRHLSPATGGAGRDGHIHEQP